MPSSGLSIPFSFAAPSTSMADTGSNYVQPGDFAVDFGDKIPGDGADSIASKIVYDISIGLAVALAARWAWKAIK